MPLVINYMINLFHVQSLAFFPKVLLPTVMMWSSLASVTR